MCNPRTSSYCEMSLYLGSNSPSAAIQRLWQGIGKWVIQCQDKSGWKVGEGGICNPLFPVEVEVGNYRDNWNGLSVTGPTRLGGEATLPEAGSGGDEGFVSAMNVAHFDRKTLCTVRQAGSREVRLLEWQSIVEKKERRKRFQIVYVPQSLKVGTFTQWFQSRGFGTREPRPGQWRKGFGSFLATPAILNMLVIFEP
ncbi:uncharacterized protein BDR25DRAFT_353180 [Lindgomyces ingoldianus]|uniref:Uncharacterized protein n=1 Tax=Lindgomyces ingoldianus TaxID=673940 RepID=A0ACB6R0M7_9PLEO|nr:uncharacterized protein BDR25DRAFT_353180 [Lindgomyces ingoldianus]KAF2472864.1 hypothetical protein BDR25DRAFT_353180 [Lindgomyces ingoldianus]